MCRNCERIRKLGVLAAEDGDEDGDRVLAFIGVCLLTKQEKGEVDIPAAVASVDEVNVRLLELNPKELEDAESVLNSLSAFGEVFLRLVQAKIRHDRRESAGRN